jgi:uncharacterized Zn finger protein
MVYVDVKYVVCGKGSAVIIQSADDNNGIHCLNCGSVGWAIAKFRTPRMFYKEAEVINIGPNEKPNMHAVHVDLDEKFKIVDSPKAPKNILNFEYSEYYSTESEWN